jgi:predicted AAA+ superfamily ATPase
LEFGLLVKIVFNFRCSTLASLRILKKAYLATPNLALVFNQSLERALPAMLENLVLNETDAKFFYRNNFEVDFIIVTENSKLIAIEVKNPLGHPKDEGEKDIKQIKKFAKKFKGKVKKAMVVDIEKEGKTEGIEIIPAWKFLLLKPHKTKNK